MVDDATPAETTLDDEDDHAAADLVAWLVEQGFTTAEHVIDEGHPGNRTTRSRRGPCQVTVSRDRGQWYVEAGPTDAGGFDMNIWEAYLRDEEPPVEPTSFDEDARTLRNLLHEIERTLVLDDAAIAHLDQLQALRQERRWSPQAF